MNEHPIPFTTEMVKAILDGRKTMTRRVVKPQPTLKRWMENGVEVGLWEWLHDCNWWYKNLSDESGIEQYCPYGQVGDRLWVRETWFPKMLYTPCDCLYKADTPNQARPEGYIGRSWKSSMFMPRWASRITLEITNIRVERLREIMPEDAIREGYPFNAPEAESRDTYINWFRTLWDSINAKRGYSWSDNPWVWIIEFRKV